jgi:hypothetical protein
MELKVACVTLLSTIVLSITSPLKAQSSISISSSKDSVAKIADGLSFATAVIITETTEAKGSAAENKWIKEHYSNYKLKTQTLSMNNAKPYDVITIIVADKTEIKLYFNIESFYDKF